MAKQHIYTRLEKGLFTGQPGYDTAAVTSGYPKYYVLETLQRYCFYETGALSESDFHPPVYFCTKTNGTGGSKALIFGKNIYLANGRGHFLSHSVIVDDEKELAGVYKSFDSFLEFDAFSSNVEVLGDIPEVDILKEINDTNSVKLSFFKDWFFDFLGIDENIFSWIVYYAFCSVTDKKQLVIKLNCDRSVCSKAAKLLVSLVASVMPEAIKTNLSFISYTASTSLRNYFGIMFIDPLCVPEHMEHKNFIDLTKQELPEGLCESFADFAAKIAFNSLDNILEVSYARSFLPENADNWNDSLNGYTNSIKDYCVKVIKSVLNTPDAYVDFVRLKSLKLAFEYLWFDDNREFSAYLDEKIKQAFPKINDIGISEICELFSVRFKNIRLYKAFGILIGINDLKDKIILEIKKFLEKQNDDKKAIYLKFFLDGISFYFDDSTSKEAKEKFAINPAGTYNDVLLALME